ncbi:GGDEF domain-containing protein [Sphingopyxis sp.]|uniref:GGDEF domain-containing protein n=1 Tax=Sphingopyxis sp. TaxID=1908224 RepID=UPI002FCC6EE5
MTAAFILGINMFVAGIFAVAFAVVAATNRTARGAWWIALGYGMGIVNVGLEFLLTRQVDPAPVGIAIFLVFLLALSFALIGVSHHYRAAPPWIAMAAIWVLTIVAVPVIFSMTYGTTPRLMLYQLPYFAMQSLFVLVIWRSGRHQALDLVLIFLQGAAATLYLVKPLIAATVGAASRPQGYMSTTYAAISQSAGVVILIAIALVFLLVMMRDTTAEMVARSETDPLSSVLNRRGFEHHAELAFIRGEVAVLIVADLDHFKKINDSFGHAAGDGVIAHFAAMLVDAAPPNAIVGRIGGEEFAALLPDALLSDGRLYAETVRAAFASARLPVLGVDRGFTASFGVAQRTSDNSLFELSRRADAALYRAKAAGRNQVRVALGEMPPMPAVGVA